MKKSERQEGREKGEKEREEGRQEGGREGGREGTCRWIHPRGVSVSWVLYSSK